jgi:hypothetical protein
MATHLAFDNRNYQVTLSAAPEAPQITDRHLSQLRAIVRHHDGRNLEEAPANPDLIADANGVAKSFVFQSTAAAYQRIYESLACLPCNVTCTPVEP